jgi:hypothetical protein
VLVYLLVGIGYSIGRYQEARCHEQQNYSKTDSDTPTVVLLILALTIFWPSFLISDERRQ